MGESSTTLHERIEALAPITVDTHRGYVSLMEELEAIDWYNQRIDAATDDELRSILRHNRDEEKEHAMMLLEWLRQRDSILDGYLRTYLFADQNPVTVEQQASDGAQGERAPTSGSLHIGDLSEA